MREDLASVAGFVCFENINLLLSSDSETKPALQQLRNALPLYAEDLETAESLFNVKLGPRTLSERKYGNIVSNFLISYIQEDHKSAVDEMLKAAALRRCLG